MAAPFHFLSQTTNNACPYLCLCLVSSGYCSIGACLDTLPLPKSFGISTFLAVIACWLPPHFPHNPFGILSNFVIFHLNRCFSLALFLSSAADFLSLLANCSMEDNLNQSFLFFFFFILESFCLFIIYFSFPNTQTHKDFFFLFSFIILYNIFVIPLLPTYFYFLLFFFFLFFYFSDFGDRAGIKKKMEKKLKEL